MYVTYRYHTSTALALELISMRIYTVGTVEQASQILFVMADKAARVYT
jgi:hypothetical protein